MAKRKRTKGLTMIYKVIHIVLTIEQQEPTQIRWWTEVPRDCKQFLLYWWHPSCSTFVTTTFIILCHFSNSYFWLNMVTSKDDQIEQRSRDSEQQCAKNNTNLGKRLVRWRYIVNAYTTCIYRLGKHHNMLLLHTCTNIGQATLVGKYEKWYMVDHWAFPLLVYMI